MDKLDLSRYMSEIGRKGGRARTNNMSPEQRKASATKAGQASVKARAAKAEAISSRKKGANHRKPLKPQSR